MAGVTSRHRIAAAEAAQPGNFHLGCAAALTPLPAAEPEPGGCETCQKSPCSSGGSVITGRPRAMGVLSLDELSLVQTFEVRVKEHSMKPGLGHTGRRERDNGGAPAAATRRHGPAQLDVIPELALRIIAVPP